MGIEVKLNSGELELALYRKFQPLLVGICDFVKAGSRNPTENPDKSVYCNAPIQIFDLSAIGRTTARLEIYVKDISGYKDSTTLSEIRLPLIESIGDGITLEESYFITVASELSQSDGNGFHFNFINLAVTIL